MREKQANSKRKLKLCFIGEGSNVHTQRHVNHFVDLGHEVHLIDEHPHNYKSLKFHLVRNPTGIKFLDYFLRILQTIIIIRGINPDILHSFQVTYHGFVGALSGKRPFVLTPWGSDILFVPESSIFYNFLTKFTILKSDVIHCIDQSVVNRLEQMYGDKIKQKDLFVLNEGVNTKLFHPVKKSQIKQVSILCLRVLRESYGALTLIEALNMLINKRKIGGIRAIMLRRGQKDYQEKVHGKIREYNLGKYITFYDWVNNKTPDYMKMADIYVDTIYRPVQGQGTGKTMLEALSSGLAVVAPDNPSIDLYIKNRYNGLIYKGSNAESLADAILQLIKNKDLRVRLGNNARKFALDKLDLSKNMRIMEKKYYSLLR